MAQNSSIQWSTHYKSMTNLWQTYTHLHHMLALYTSPWTYPFAAMWSRICCDEHAVFHPGPFAKDLRWGHKIHKWSTVEVLLYGFTQSFSIKQPPSPKHSLLRQVWTDTSTPQLVPQHSRRGTVPRAIWEVMAPIPIPSSNLINVQQLFYIGTHACAFLSQGGCKSL